MTLERDERGKVRKWIRIALWSLGTLLILAVAAVYALVRISMSID